MTKTKPVNFDEYADQYEELLMEQLAFFSKDRGYFSEYKVVLAVEHCSIPPARVLDFGCGIGLSLPFLSRHFPAAKIFATDLSERSLAHVREQFPDVNVLPDDSLNNHTFDVIFVSGVFHHVPLQQRDSVVKRLASLLATGGQLFVFEHNPFNPVTRHMVATCPFDEDAELISFGKMRSLITKVGGLRFTAGGYCLFFPQSLARLRRIEKLLSWLPLGGQYFVVGEKR